MEEDWSVAEGTSLTLNRDWPAWYGVQGIDRVQLDAPAKSAAFFVRQGFKVVRPGPERVGMMKRLTVCS
jgi:hypothetical protein